MAQKPNENNFMNFIRNHIIAISIVATVAVAAALAAAAFAFFANPAFVSMIAGKFIAQYASSVLAQAGIAAAAAGLTAFLSTSVFATAFNGLAALFRGNKNPSSPSGAPSGAPAATTEAPEGTQLDNSAPAPEADSAPAPEADLVPAPEADLVPAPEADSVDAPVVAPTVPSLPLANMPLDTSVSPATTTRANGASASVANSGFFGRSSQQAEEPTTPTIALTVGQ